MVVGGVSLEEGVSVKDWERRVRRFENVAMVVGVGSLLGCIAVSVVGIWFAEWFASLWW